MAPVAPVDLPNRHVYDAGSSWPATREYSACESGVLVPAAVPSRRTKRHPVGAVIDCEMFRFTVTTAS